MYRPITMYQIVCDRCGEVFGSDRTLEKTIRRSRAKALPLLVI